MIRNFLSILLLIVLIPCHSYGEADLHVQKMEDLYKRYREFVKHGNKALDKVFHDCVHSKPSDLVCIESTNQMRFLLYESYEELETFAVLYKSLVHGQECFDNDFKMDIYSALSGAKINFSRNYEQIKELCHDNEKGKYLTTRCEAESAYVEEFLEISNYILKISEHYIKVPAE